MARITATAKKNSEHLLHHKVTAVDAACPQRLVSRRPFSRHAARLCNDNYDPAKAWSDRVDSGPPLIRTVMWARSSTVVAAATAFQHLNAQSSKGSFAIIDIYESVQRVLFFNDPVPPSPKRTLKC